jgi:RHS repeat-associated protein
MYYHSDGNGNVTMLVNPSQYIVAKYLYDAFGNVLSAAGSLAQQNLYRFSSREAHVNSGLVYYLYRYYDPHLQRWANRDPFGEKGGLNLYDVLGDDSVNKADLFGLDCYVINGGGYTGHTSFVVDNPYGGVTAYHFFAKNHNETAPWYLQDIGLIYDGVHIWPQYANSLQDYLAGEQAVYGSVNILGVGLGTPQDDARAIQQMQQEMQAQEGYYSLLGGSECHKQSWDWFHDYTWGGQDVPTWQIQGLGPIFINGQLVNLPSSFAVTPALQGQQLSIFASAPEQGPISILTTFGSKAF